LDRRADGISDIANGRSTPAWQEQAPIDSRFERAAPRRERRTDLVLRRLAAAVVALRAVPAGAGEVRQRRERPVCGPRGDAGRQMQ
jgi:hypothetical protein